MRWIVPFTVVAVLLTVVPGLSRAFFTPKLWVFCGGTALSLAFVRRSSLRGAPVALGGALVVATLLSGITGAVASREAALLLLVFAVSFGAWPSLALDRRLLAASIAGAGAAVAVLTLLQAAGLDPLAASTTSGRLRSYGTLGNPDFVASAMVPCAAIALGGANGPRRSLWLALAGIQLASLFVLHSFATLLSLGAAAGIGALRLEPRLRRRLVIAALLAIALVAPYGRSWREAIAGRLYLHAVALPAALEAPPFGRGPGAVEALWPLFELDLWKSRCGDDRACVAAHAERRFAALQDHVHDDYLEAWIERGPVGLVVLLALAGWSLFRGRRSHTPLALSATAGIAAILVRAAIDFPLARPADLALWSALLALEEDAPS